MYIHSTGKMQHTKKEQKDQRTLKTVNVNGIDVMNENVGHSGFRTSWFLASISLS